MTSQTLLRLVLATALFQTLGCKKDKDEGDDSDTETLTPPAGNGGGGGGDPNGTVTIKATAFSRGLELLAGPQKYDLTSLDFGIIRVALRQEGAAEAVEFVVEEGEGLDLINGTGELKVEGVAPGSYDYAEFSVGDVTLAATFTRHGSECDGEPADVHATAVGLFESFAVSAGSDTALSLALPPTIDLRGGSCDYRPRVSKLLLGPESGLAAGLKKHASSNAFDLNVTGKWSTGCIDDGTGGKETTEYLFKADGTVKLSYVAYEDAACATKLFGFDGFFISLVAGKFDAAGSFTEVDPIYGHLSLTAYTQDEADGLSSGSFCGEASWQIGVPVPCNDDLEIPYGKKIYGLLGMKEGVLYWDEDAGDTAAQRPTALSDTKYFYVGAE